MNTFGEKLATIRKSKNMTQEALAARVGISAATVSLYESDLRSPTAPVLFALCDALGITCDDLADEPRPKEDAPASKDEFVSVVQRLPMVSGEGKDYIIRQFELWEQVSRLNRRKKK